MPTALHRKVSVSCPKFNRRRFLDSTRKTTLGFAAGATILTSPGSVRATPANDRLVLATIGVGGGRGHSLAMGFLNRGDCEISYICDVNRRLHEPRAKEYASRQGGKRPKCLQDFREMLDDASVDAVVIATPAALARPDDDSVLPCRQGRLLREAAEPELLGRAPGRRGRSKV